MPIPTGSRIGHYEIVAPLGAGGMGEVYRARDPRIGRDVAIKVLPGAVAANADRLARFTLEARTAGGLSHPNLLVLFDIGTHEGGPYLVTELLEGQTLRERLLAGAIPLRKVIEWTSQIADGVAAAHEKGIVHRDIKPENIFITRDERVKVLDFGLAKLLGDDAPPQNDDATAAWRTDPGSVLGTPGYMSPEQVRAESIDERADIFALGIVTAEMATGTHPFQRPTRVETMTAILQSDPELSESLSPGLARIIEHMLAKRPAARFQSMRDVAFALQFLSGSSGSSSDLAAQAGKAASRDTSALPPKFMSITYRRGRIGSARFTPEGSIVYGAAWEGAPFEIFVSYPGTPDARPIGISNADILSVSPTGELAVSLGRHFVGGWASTGTLARVPLAGGAPRKIADQVVDADWAADGKNFAIVRIVDSMFVLEYPIGKRLWASGGWISRVRFSRDGQNLAFIDHPWFGDDAGRPVVIDLKGNVVMDPGAPLNGTSGLCWSPDGTEVWVAGDNDPYGRDVMGWDMTGRTRVVMSAPGQMTICDARPSGELIISHDNWRREVYVARHGEPPERNLAWFDWPMLNDISVDGSHILIEEQRAVAADQSGSQFYLRPSDGGPAVHLGNGRARCISPDGEWVAAHGAAAGHFELIPTGIGETKLVRFDGIDQAVNWYWFPDGKRLLVVGAGADKKRLVQVVPIDGSEPTVAGPGNLGYSPVISPDGERIIGPAADERLMIYQTNGQESEPLKGSKPGEWAARWSDDGKYVYVYPRGRSALTIDRIEIETGERVAWQDVRPGDQAGILDIFPLCLTPDGEHYAFSYRRCLSDLYLVFP